MEQDWNPSSLTLPSPWSRSDDNGGVGRHSRRRPGGESAQGSLGAATAGRLGWAGWPHEAPRPSLPFPFPLFRAARRAASRTGPLPPQLPGQGVRREFSQEEKVRRPRDRAVAITGTRGADGRRRQVLGAGPSRAEHPEPGPPTCAAPLSAARCSRAGRRRLSGGAATSPRGVSCLIQVPCAQSLGSGGAGCLRLPQSVCGTTPNVKPSSAARPLRLN